MTQRVLYVQAQVVLGTFDDEGNLTGEQPVPEIKRIYSPHGLKLQVYVDEIAAECRKEQKAE